MLNVLKKRKNFFWTWLILFITLFSVRLTPKQSSLSALVQKDEDSLFSTSLSETVAVASVGREDVAVCSLNLPGTGYTREEQATLLKEQSEICPSILGFSEFTSLNLFSYFI